MPDFLVEPCMNTLFREGLAEIAHERRARRVPVQPRFIADVHNTLHPFFADPLPAPTRVVPVCHPDAARAETIDHHVRNGRAVWPPTLQVVERALHVARLRSCGPPRAVARVFCARRVDVASWRHVGLASKDDSTRRKTTAGNSAALD